VTTLSATVSETHDLAVAPLDGRIASDSLYEEEVDLFAKADFEITAGSSTCSGGCDFSGSSDTDL
jgi:hypothetical protein